MVLKKLEHGSHASHEVVNTPSAMHGSPETGGTPAIVVVQQHFRPTLLKPRDCANPLTATHREMEESGEQLRQDEFTTPSSANVRRVLGIDARGPHESACWKSPSICAPLGGQSPIEPLITSGRGRDG